MFGRIHPVKQILASNFNLKDQRAFQVLYETNAQAVDSGIGNLLYQQIRDFRLIDFGAIPKSGGDVKKLAFYDDMVQALAHLLDNEISRQGAEVVERSLRNIEVRAKDFNLGFKMKKEFVQLTYNTLVYSCLDSISHLIGLVGRSLNGIATTYEDSIPIRCLDRFNATCQTAEFDKAMRSAIQYDEDGNKEEVFGARKEAFDGGMVAIFSIAAVLLFIPILRELIFYFYYLRMKLSDYTKVLADYLKLNEVAVENNETFEPVKKRKIIENQNKWISVLMKISDKLRVEQVKATTKTEVKIKEANKDISLDNIKTEVNRNTFDFA